MSRVRQFLQWLIGAPSLLGLTEAERRTLMTWGMLGGMVALTAVLLWIIHLADGHFDRHDLGQVQVAIVGGLFDVAYAVIVLSALLAVGMVAIARGGSMEARLSRDGVSISLSGRRGRGQGGDAIGHHRYPARAPCNRQTRIGEIGMLGIAASLLLLGLFTVKAGEARHWHKQSGRFEQLYLGEQCARAQTVANYRAAAETARKDDLANAGRVAAAQTAISERTTHNFETRLADARAHAQRLQLAQRTPATVGGGARAAAVPAVGATPGAAGGAATEDGFSVGAKDLSLDERLIATQQAIQLDELVKWVNAQSKVDSGAETKPH